MRALTSALLLLWGTGLIAACSENNAGSDSASLTTSDPNATTRQTEADMTSTEQSGPTLERVVERSRDDLATRLSVANEGIEVVTARRVTWGDGSIGCPEPGMMYTQALVPGFYIHLRHDGKDAYYHVGSNGQPMHCPAERSKPPIDPENLR